MNGLQNLLVVAQGNLFTEGLAILVVGMGVVFIALTALIIILEFMGKTFDALNKKEEEAKKLSEKAVATPEVIEPIVEEVIAEIDDLELVAVITATIAASMGTSADNLQVRSLRKTNNVWGMSGRTEQLYN